MPPFEGFDTSSLRHGASLYDNLVDEVNTYSNGLREKLQLSFATHFSEDVVATRDIMLGRHPLDEPDTPERDEWESVLGKDRVASGEEKEDFEMPSWRKFARKQPHQNETHRRVSCNNPAQVLEWLELFIGMCGTSPASRNYSTWPNDDEEVHLCTPPTKTRPKPPVQLEERVLLKPIPQRNRVLYPIAKYPSRLNSPRLVEQRRRFLEKQINFKPLRPEVRKPRKSKAEF